MSTGFCANKGSSIDTFTILFTVVLSYFGLQTQVIPLHISLDQFRNWSDYTCQQAYINSVLSDTWHIQSKILIEFSKIGHFVVEGLWCTNFISEIFRSAFITHFRNENLRCLSIPIACSSWLVSLSHIWDDTTSSTNTTTPSCFDLRLGSITATSCSPDVCHFLISIIS